MIATKPEPGAPRELAVDHPGRLGDLAPVFHDRNIAVAMAPDGYVLLLRPNSALLASPKAGNNESLANFVERYDPKQAENIRRGLADDERSFIKVTFPGEPTLVPGSEKRWSIATVNDFLNAAAANTNAQGEREPLLGEYNHVVIGAQSVVGSPLGVSAAWAGEMAFTGKVTETNDNRTVMLTLAEPIVPPPFLRDRVNIDGHDRPGVLVLDTGLRTVALEQGQRPADASGSDTRGIEHNDLKTCFVHKNWVLDQDPGDVDDEDEPFDPPVFPARSPTERPTESDQVLDFEAGHGTFIAGIIRQICPDANIYSAGVLSSFGDGDVDGVIASLQRILDEIDDPIHVVVMSFGTNLIDDDPGLFGAELSRLLGDRVGVAAAGNQSTCRPYFPAALPDVVGVGGLAADGKAWFTNFGGWVDACAPAVDVVSTFFEDFPETLDGTLMRHYKGWARWSGTSFSAPKVAAVIAQEMYLNQVSAKEAWKRVTSHKHLRFPDLGIVFNV